MDMVELGLEVGSIELLLESKQYALTGAIYWAVEVRLESNKWWRQIKAMRQGFNSLSKSTFSYEVILVVIYVDVVGGNL